MRHYILILLMLLISAACGSAPLTPSSMPSTTTTANGSLAAIVGLWRGTTTTSTKGHNGTLNATFAATSDQDIRADLIWQIADDPTSKRAYIGTATGTISHLLITSTMTACIFTMTGALNADVFSGTYSATGPIPCPVYQGTFLLNLGAVPMPQ